MKFCILLLLLIFGCSGSQQSIIEKILLSDEFAIKVHYVGCFATTDVTYKILKTDDGKILEYPQSVNEPEKISRTLLTEEKEKLLRSFLLEGIKEKKKEYCTSQATYRVGTFWNNISFEDQSCELGAYLERLTK
jgi:hypothetical protein